MFKDPPDVTVFFPQGSYEETLNLRTKFILEHPELINITPRSACSFEGWTPVMTYWFTNSKGEKKKFP